MIAYIMKEHGIKKILIGIGIFTQLRRGLRLYDVETTVPVRLQKLSYG